MANKELELAVLELTTTLIIINTVWVLQPSLFAVMQIRRRVFKATTAASRHYCRPLYT